VAQWVSLEHEDRLKEAAAAGKGVILVTAHFGNWELGGAVLGALGYPVNAVVLPQRMKRLNRLLQDQREKRGIRLLPLGKSARGLVRCLRGGDVVALLADRDFTRHHHAIDFFGRPARLPLGAAWLSLHTGAPIVPTFLLRQEDDTFLLRMHQPIWPEQAGDVNAIMTRIRDALQAEIGERPYQWFIFRDFWRGEGANETDAQEEPE